jgi:hypothetical protein
VLFLPVVKYCRSLTPVIFIEIGDYFITWDNDTVDNLSPVTATTEKFITGVADTADETLKQNQPAYTLR